MLRAELDNLYISLEGLPFSYALLCIVHITLISSVSLVMRHSLSLGEEMLMGNAGCNIKKEKKKNKTRIPYPLESAASFMLSSYFCDLEMYIASETYN